MRRIQNVVNFEPFIHPIISTNLMLDVSCGQMAKQPASSWLMLVFGPIKLSKPVIPHSKCDLISFLLLYRWKNTQFVQQCDSQSTSSGVYFPTWLRSVNKEADTPSVSETGLTCGAPPSRHGFRGLVIPHYSNGLRSQTPRGCSHRSKSFPIHSSCSS